MEFLRKLRQNLIEWNLFVPEENEYDDADDNEHQDQLQLNSNIEEQQLHQQRISTRVYVLLLNSILVILIIFTLSQQQTKIITLNQPSMTPYQQLQIEYSDTLHCPCSALTISYQTFTTVDITLHQICSSIFISEEWISSLYFSYHGQYLPTDFRTTASSQFKLLNGLCRLIKTTLLDIVLDINRTQLISPNLLLETQLNTQVAVTAQFIRNQWLKRFINTLQLNILITRSDRLISAVNTNYIFALVYNGVDKLPGWYRNSISWYITEHNQTTICNCNNNFCQYPASFYSITNVDDAYSYWNFRPEIYEISDALMGFMSSCTPLEALLQGTFECLYSFECITILMNYFPKLDQVISINNTLNQSLSSRYPLNVNVSSLLDELFIEQWMIKINYDQYFKQCLPNSCTYSYTKRADLIYMIIIILSLYGGLQTVPRKLIPLIIKLILNGIRRSGCNNTTLNRSTNNHTRLGTGPANRYRQPAGILVCRFTGPVWLNTKTGRFSPVFFINF